MSNLDLQAPVPPLGIHRKIKIAHALSHIRFEYEKEHWQFYVREISKDWTPEELAYAKFWWKREERDPDWRAKDPNQNKPIAPRLTLVGN